MNFANAYRPFKKFVLVHVSRNLDAHDVKSGYLRDPAEQLANQKFSRLRTLKACNTAELEA